MLPSKSPWGVLNGVWAARNLLRRFTTSVHPAPDSGPKWTPAAGASTWEASSGSVRHRFRVVCFPGSLLPLAMLCTAAEKLAGCRLRTRCGTRRDLWLR